jgi:hypothetical protein
VLSFLRKNQGAGESVLVALNMSAETRALHFDLGGAGVKGSSGRLLVPLGGRREEVSLSEITIPPYGVLVAAVK